MKRVSIFLLFMCSVAFGSSQKFSATLRFIPEGWNCEIKAIPDQHIVGTVKKVEFENGFIKAVNLRTIDGQEVHIESQYITKALINGNTYEKHKLPGSNETVLLQMLNSKFEGELNIFLNPTSDFYAENGMVRYYSYYYAFRNQESVSLIKKANFEKSAQELFGNCEMINGCKDLMQGEFVPFLFDCFESYVWHYNTYCH